MPGLVGQMVSPLRVWKSKYEPVLLRCAAIAAGILDLATVRHCSGGPVEPAHPFALCELAHAKTLIARSKRHGIQALREQMLVKNDLIFGDFEGVLALLAEYITVALAAGDGFHGQVALSVFWGYASWNGTQLLGEIARRGWGLTASPENLSMLNETWAHVCDWEGIVDSTVVARENEFSRS